MRINLARTGFATVAIVATTLVAPVPTAQAGTAVRSFDLETIEGARPHHGSARTWGSLTWHDKTKVVANGRINDRCPGDGYGAYLDIAVEYMDGDLNPRHGVARDDRGCAAAGGDSIAFPSPVTFDSTRWIKAVHMCLWEINVDTSPDSLGDRKCDSFPNPYI